MGNYWFGQLPNEDFALFAPSDDPEVAYSSDKGFIKISIYNKEFISGKILGQVYFDGIKYFIEPTIEIIDKDFEIRKINF